MAGGDYDYLVAALLTVDGVAHAAVEGNSDVEGPGVLCLRLVDGADEAAVAAEVSRVLRTDFRLAADLARMQVIPETEPVLDLPAPPPWAVLEEPHTNGSHEPLEPAAPFAAELSQQWPAWSALAREPGPDPEFEPTSRYEVEWDPPAEVEPVWAYEVDPEPVEADPEPVEVDPDHAEVEPAPTAEVAPDPNQRTASPEAADATGLTLPAPPRALAPEPPEALAPEPPPLEPSEALAPEPPEAPAPEPPPLEPPEALAPEPPEAPAPRTSFRPSTQAIPALLSMTGIRPSAADELFGPPAQKATPAPAPPVVLSETREARRTTRTAARTTSAASRRAASRPEPPSSGRLSIESVQMLTTGARAVASVILSLDGRSFFGEAEGVRSGGSARCVAVAALRAVEAAVGGRARFAADYVEFAGADRDRAVVCVVTMVSNRRTERLSGAVAVRDDVAQAVVQAVLAAVNRQVLSLQLDAS